MPLGELAQSGEIAAGCPRAARPAGGIVIRPTTRTGQRSRNAGSSSGAIPPLPASPATLTSIRISGVRRAVASELREHRVAGHRVDVAHVRQQVAHLAALQLADEVPGEPSRERAALATSSWARFSPTSVTPPSASAGSSSTGRYLTAARISTSAGSRPAAAISLAHALQVGRARVRASRPWIRSTTPRPPGGR